jgi:hypothetical protein
MFVFGGVDKSQRRYDDLYEFHFEKVFLIRKKFLSIFYIVRESGV